PHPGLDDLDGSPVQLGVTPDTSGATMRSFERIHGCAEPRGRHAEEPNTCPDVVDDRAGVDMTAKPLELGARSDRARTTSRASGRARGAAGGNTAEYDCPGTRSDAALKARRASTVSRDEPREPQPRLGEHQALLLRDWRHIAEHGPRLLG